MIKYTFGKFIKVFGLVLLALFLVGFLLPFLISSKSYLGVALGLGIILFLIGLVLWKLISTSQLFEVDSEDNIEG